MKTAASSYNLEMPQGNYFIEDLYKIYELLNSVTEEVKIKTERYEFACFEDLRQFDGRIRKISFISSNPFICVEIDKRVKIHTNQDIPITKGIIEQIENFQINTNSPWVVRVLLLFKCSFFVVKSCTKEGLALR